LPIKHELILTPETELQRSSKKGLYESIRVHRLPFAAVVFILMST